MIALRLLNTESQDKADYLHNQLITDINVPSTYWECAESYLKGVGIYDVFLIEEQDFRNYKIFLRETGNFTKKQVFAIASFSPAIGLAGVVLCGFFAPQNMVIVAISGIFYKLGSGLTLGATTVMLADVIDYGQVKLGSRNESIIASFQTLLVKTASAVSAWLIGVGLTIVGYVANAEQSASTIMGMRVLMGVVPSVITILAFVIYAKGYKLEGAYLEEIMEKIKGNKTEETEE